MPPSIPPPPPPTATMNQVSTPSPTAPTRPQLGVQGRLSPATVHRAYNLASPPIRFPAASGSSASVPLTHDAEEKTGRRHVKRELPAGPEQGKNTSPSSSTSSLSRSPRPTRCHLPRPSASSSSPDLPRKIRSLHLSYETFPIPPPRTPWEERDLPRALGDYLPRMVGRAVLPVGMRSREERKALGVGKDEEEGRVPVVVGEERERERLIGPPRVQMEGVPKLTRECFWSEFKCYGKYILPVVLVFGVLVIVVSLSFYSARL